MTIWLKKKCSRKGLNFGIWVSFYLRNIALNLFSLGCSLLSRYYVCKQPSVFQAVSFGDLLLNEKQKKPFVSLKDEVTITQSLLTSVSLAQVDNAPNGDDSNLFCRDTRGFNSRSVKSFFFLFCFCSSFKTLLRVFVIEDFGGKRAEGVLLKI